MGDVDEVMDIAKKLDMNPNEQKKYKVHLDTIKYNAQKTSAWKANNYLWQVIFFGTLFIGAMIKLVEYLEYVKYIDTKYAEFVVGFISSWFGVAFWIFVPFAFPLMMWSGIVRGKWEGKLTRSTAYALSFLENIEHRQYLEEQQVVRVLKKPKK